MQNSVRKIFPLATAFLLALCSASNAGDNAGVVVSMDGDTEISGVGAGATVEVALSAAGMVGVKQFDVTLTVSPADAFDLSSATFTFLLLQPFHLLLVPRQGASFFAQSGLAFSRATYRATLTRRAPALRAQYVKG